MISSSFEESNRSLSKPPGMSHEQCESLCVADSKTLDGTPVVVSCWKLTQSEVEEFQSIIESRIKHVETQLTASEAARRELEERAAS